MGILLGQLDVMRTRMIALAPFLVSTVPRRPTTSIDSRAMAYCVCSGWECGLFGHFSLICLFFLPLSGLVVLGLTALLGCISVYIGPSPRAREKDESSL